MRVYGRRASGLASHDSMGCLGQQVSGGGHVLRYLCDEMTIHIWVELLEKIARVFGAVPSQVLVF